MYEALGAKTDDTDKTKDNAQQDRKRGRGFVAGSRKSYLWDLPACISSGEEFAERHGRAIYEQVATEDEDDDARGAAAEQAEIEAEIARDVAADELQRAIMRMLVHMHDNDPKAFEDLRKLRHLSSEEAEAVVKRCRKMAWS